MKPKIIFSKGINKIFLSKIQIFLLAAVLSLAVVFSAITVNGVKTGKFTLSQTAKNTKETIIVDAGHPELA